MSHLVADSTSEMDIADFLRASKVAADAEQELVGFALALRERAKSVSTRRIPLLDTCGTGGDGLGSFNFSTAAALVVAGAGVAVAKHGNRSSSSRCGSADVLESLGVPIQSEPEAAGRALDAHGFAFLFAPAYHPAVKRVAAVRRALKVRTVFNLLGPLVNPAPVTGQVVGIYDPALLHAYARALLALGVSRAMVVHAEDGMDELSLAAPTRVVHAREDRGIWEERVTPEDAGLTIAPASSLRGGEATENARLMEAVITGEPGPLLDCTLLNAAAALVVAGKARDLREGVEAARECVTGGAAASVLRRLQGTKT
jgi:anthranilate phosphoribosyltransferase